MAAAGGDYIGHAGGGGVRAVGGSEGVVHIHIRVGGELLGERGVIGFLFSVVTDVFQQE